MEKPSISSNDQINEINIRKKQLDDFQIKLVDDRDISPYRHTSRAEAPNLSFINESVPQDFHCRATGEQFLTISK
jgi:hypothetical protein